MHSLNAYIYLPTCMNMYPYTVLYIAHSCAVVWLICRQSRCAKAVLKSDVEVLAAVPDVGRRYGYMRKL